jgi:hypothetical protein
VKNGDCVSTRRGIGSVLLVGLPLCSPAWSQEKLWLEQFGTPALDAVLFACRDGAGGQLIAGYTRGNLGAPHVGAEDAFLSRIGPAGERLWTRQFGTPANDRAHAIALGDSGEVYLAGFTQGSLAAANMGFADAWVARYTSDGTQVWLRQFGTSGNDAAVSLVKDGSGGIFVVGFTTEALAGPKIGFNDVFVVRMDSTGEIVQGTQFGGASDDFPMGARSDGQGGLVIAGYTGSSLHGPNQGEADAFVSRLTGDLSLMWTRQLGTPAWDMAFSVCAGPSGIFVSGETRGSLAAPWQGFGDAFVALYSHAGSQIWVRQFGTAGFDQVFRSDCDGVGRVYLGGHTGGGPVPGNGDGFLTVFDASGDRGWTHYYATPMNESVYGVVLEGDGTAFVSGSTQGALGGPNQGDADIFISRVRISCYANCDESTSQPVLNVGDFACFLNKFAAGHVYANCDQSTQPPTLNVADFACFLTKFAIGCN